MSAVKPDKKPSAMGFWMDNGMSKPKPMPFIVVDCGYVKHQRARDNVDRLVKVLGVKGKKGFVELVGHGRLVVRCPDDKERLLQRRFKKIKPVSTYCWTTHTYDGSGPQFKLKEAM